MCGIAGYSGLSPEKGRALLDSMAAALSNRGPDDTGFLASGTMGLAHRRLSIIDLSDGHQPLFNEDNTIALVLNGEIYNYRELHKELVMKGHSFQSQSDSEVVIHMYEEYGEQFLNRLDGMFALAITDFRKNLLLLARDKMGEKPLHYVDCGSVLLFASEIKALVPVAGEFKSTTFDLNFSALTHFLSLQYVPDNMSIYQGIEKLPPASAMIVKEGRIFSRWSYWKLPATEINPNRTDATKETRKIILESVKSRSVADVPVAVFLSGGIDSSIVTAALASENGSRIKTFTAAFSEKQFDESEKAASIAEKYGTEHQTILIAADEIQNRLQSILAYMDEPYADPSALPYAILCEYAAKQVKVVLGGDGGDELFGGYLRYKLDSFLPESGMPLAGKIIKRLAAGLTVDHNKPVGQGIKLGVKRLPQALSIPQSASMLRWSSYFSPEDLMQLFNKDILKYINPFDAHDYLTSVYTSANEGRNASVKSRAADLLTYTAGDYLVKSDRMGMRSGLEVRNPLLSPSLTEWALSLNPTLLKPFGSKGLLREAFKKDLTSSVLKSSKRGFSVPVSLWMKGSWLDMYRDLSRSEISITKTLFNSRFIEILITEHMAMQNDHGKKLYALLALEIWHRR
ncbi:MAG: asparagine synthase (glutamine-hydrolyzing) [Fibrobacteres bacterium]|nr:asparagine synthase (glutamine-hydrolyzing) [Fibrobacterota bacterium]